MTTFPLGVLQDHLRFDLPAAAPPRSGLPPVPRSRSLFTPPLPEDKVRAIMRLGMGNEEKVVLFWPKPFWDESLMYFRHPRRHDFRVCHVYALTRKPEDRGWLTLMTPPPLSDTFGAGDDAAVVAAVMQVLWLLQPPDPRDAETQSPNSPATWRGSRFSKGRVAVHIRCFTIAVRCCFTEKTPRVIVRSPYFLVCLVRLSSLSLMLLLI